MRHYTDKIISLDNAEAIIQKEKQKGHKVVLCHGVFDLLHSGHLLHFRSAKQHGHKLIVSVTPDCFVNKGPHRPFLSENIRAQHIAELESVDYVVLNQWSTAIETIYKLKPDIYAKGSDYANPQDDITGNIQREEAALKEVNGKIIFTNEPSMSSSNLLNQFFPTYSAEAQEYLRIFKQKYSMADIHNVFEQLTKLKILVIGEAILDRYTYCLPLAKSIKETIIATKYLEEEDFLGGALAIANHVSNFCNKTTLITNLGPEDNIQCYVKKHLNQNIELKNIYISGRSTIIKQRFVEKSFLTKMFEIQSLNDEPIAAETEKNIISLLQEQILQHDLILVADYGHGFITRSIVENLENLNHFLCVNTQTNCANLGFNLLTKYKKIDYASIDSLELKLATNEKHATIENQVEILKHKIGFNNILVSLGADGTVIFPREGNAHFTPIFSNKVVDRVGAGDAVFSLTSPLVFLKCPLPILGLIANCAGALKVKTVCNRKPLHSVDLKKFITAILA